MQEWESIDPESDPRLRNLNLTNNASMIQLLRGQVDITQLHNGLAIQTNSYVGRVDVGPLSLTILPKVQKDTLLNLVRYAFRLRQLTTVAETRHNLSSGLFQDLLITQLILECQELVSRGLHREYLARRENLPSPRGRIDVQRVVQDGGVIRTFIPCVHYPRSTDGIMNQMMLSGLLLASRLTDDLELRARARRIANTLEDQVTAVRLTSEVMMQADRKLSRQTVAYEPMLVLISLLLQGMGVSFEADDMRQPLPGFLFDMNRFWEALLSRFLAENLIGVQVQDQFPLRHLMSYAQGYNPQRRPAPTPRPDFVILRNGCIERLLDAKYRDIWTNGLPTNMLYQLAIYALSQGLDGRATILYPVVDQAAKREVVEISNPVNEAKKAQVILQPINLHELEKLILAKGIDGERSRHQYTEGLLQIKHVQKVI